MENTRLKISVWNQKIMSTRQKSTAAKYRLITMCTTTLTGYCQYAVSTGKEAFVCHGNKMIAPHFS